jgi:hypothetical protein
VELLRQLVPGLDPPHLVHVREIRLARVAGDGRVPFRFGSTVPSATRGSAVWPRSVSVVLAPRRNVTDGAMNQRSDGSTKSTNDP